MTCRLNRNTHYDTNIGSWIFEGDIYTVQPDGNGLTPLTNDEFNNVGPSWSPDGEWIVFSSDRDGNSSMDIWLMGKNGQNMTKVYDCTPASCYGPSFSPDGRTLPFSQGSSIYTVDRNGDPTTLVEIAQPGLLTGGLKWSPMLPSTSLRVQAEPIQITAGEESVLSWESKRAVEVTVDGVPEKQPANGSVIVSPNTTTTYTLRAIGPKGAKETTVTVVVQ